MTNTRSAASSLGFFSACWQIWWREFLEDAASLRLLLLIVIFSVGFAASVYLSLNDYHYDYAKFTKYTSRGPILSFLYERPDVVTVMAQGASGRIAAPNRPGVIMTEPEAEPLAGDRNPLRVLAGSGDYLHVSSALLALCALLLSYSTVNKEREDGTLRLLLANAVPRLAVFWGKFLRGVTSILIPLSISFALCAILIRNSAELDVRRASLVCMMFGASFIYAVVFYAVGMVISIFVRNSRLAIVVAILAWAWFVLIVPATTPIIADAVKPIPTRSELQTAQNEARNRYLGPEQLNKIFKENKPSFAEARTNAVVAVNQITNDYLRRAQAHNEVAEKLARTSPSGCYTLALTYLAGTSLMDQSRYLNRVRDGIRDIVVGTTTSPVNAPYASSLGVVDRIHESSTDLALLILYLIVAVILGNVGLAYYDPR